jgi:glycosyltransferase involved in cell wall biosynthesis
MTGTALVSVCIPTYRGEAHIAETIRSVLLQTFDDFELVIVDDNSPDDTARFVASYADRRIRFIRNPANIGPEANWNRCLREARGKYFKLLPHDDLLDPDCLRRQVEVLENDTEQTLALVCSARNMINAAGVQQTVRGYPGHREGRILSATAIRQCVHRGTNLLGEPGCVLMRRELAESVGTFNGAFPYVIDLEYWFRLLLHGDAWYIDDTLASFRISRGQWSVAIGQRQSEDFSRFISHVSTRPEYGIGMLDISLGYGMARVNNVLRLLYYRFVLDRNAA